MTTKHPRITTDSEVCHGAPCIRGLRIRVIDILDMLYAGSSHQEILDSFPLLEAEDIPAAIVWHKDRVAKLERTEEYLEALRQGGVDNWDWYGESIQNYLRNNNLPDDYFDGI